MDDISDIKEMYDQGVDQEQQRLDRHQLEHELTWRYLTRYLPREGSILEIGAATGRYTLELCRKGYSVTAVDLSNVLLDEARRRLSAEGLDKRARLLTADARDLRDLNGMQFDAVLMMGPLYHLVLEDDRKEAVRQAIALLYEGGLFFSTFISRVGVLGDLLKKTPEWIQNGEEVSAFLASGRRPDDQPRGGFRGYFAHASEIESFHEELGLKTLVLAAVEPAISADDASFNMLQEPLRELWLNLLFVVSTDKTTIGASRHLLYVGKKLQFKDKI